MRAPLIALVAGLAVGWLDVNASEVQGPLLILMLAAFLIALVSRVPAWSIALSVASGLPLGHLLSLAVRGTGDPQWAMLLATLPALAAAYGGRGVASLFGLSTSVLKLPSHLIGASLLACAIVGVVPVYATSVARDQPFAWWVTIVWQVISLIAWALAAPLVLRAWQRRHRDGRAITPLEIASEAGIAGGIAVVHAIALPLFTRLLLVPLGRRGTVNAIEWALAAYLPLDTLTCSLIVGLGHLSSATRREQDAAEREIAVRGELAAARLAALRAQLRPHFLFNALNAATVLARRKESEGAGRVLTQLADLLRYVLRDADTDSAVHAFVPLSEEIAFVESYLAIERERFPDRLRTSTEIAPGVEQALVPHLLLQPLVENAVHHGIGKRIGTGAVVIRAWQASDKLHVTVEDEGPGIETPTSPTGVGLRNTRARLATLYGDTATLTLADRAGGGAVAHVRLPFRT